MSKSTRFRILLRKFADGAPGEIRTPDPHIRSVMLYPAELQAHFSAATIDTETKDPLPLGCRSENGAPGEIRTPDPLVRSQILYPAELRAHIDFLIVPNFPLNWNSLELQLWFTSKSANPNSPLSFPASTQPVATLCAE